LSGLADRIRGIVRPSAAGLSPPVTDESQITNRESLERLEGERQEGTFVIERARPPQSRHGGDAVGTYAACLDEAALAVRLFAPTARGPLVFFDLETTGLSGGAGTIAFLVGCGSFQPDGGFVTRQFLLTTPAEERRLLEHVHGELSAAGAIVSFNGKSFDAPLLESRFAFHRIARTLAEQPHVDTLHPARQFWGSVGGGDCSLVSLERRLLGVRRAGDVDGFEVPARYFRFVRTGDAGPLEAVLEHNRLDLLTLAALTVRLLALAHGGEGAARDAREAIALGRLYARAGEHQRARDAFERGVELASLRGDGQSTVDALRGLAALLRRARDYQHAAACWRRLIDLDECPSAVAREAAEALAIHHEHRVRDLEAARQFALRSLKETERTPRWVAGVRYRMARIDRKLSGRLL
jgi:hypothetical protein